MTDVPLPHSPHDIDPAWLTDALRPRHPDVRVAHVEVREVRQVTNTHAFLRIDYDGASTAPADMFCKMLPLAPDRRALLARSEMGPREVHFYDHLKPRLPSMR